MAIPTSKPLNLSTVQTEYGGSNPISMSEYRGRGNAPATGPIDLWGDFNGTSNLVTESSSVNRYDWAGTSNHTTEDTSVTSILQTNNTSYNPTTGTFDVYVKQTSEPWVGKTITSITNPSIFAKVTLDYDQDSGPLAPPWAQAGTTATISLYNNNGTVFGGNSFATAGSVQASYPSSNIGTIEVTVVSSTDFANYLTTNSLTDADLRDWVSDGGYARIRMTGEFNTDDGASATADSGAVFYIELRFDSITYQA